MNRSEKKLIVVTGPTAIGKTALAIQVAQHFKTEIISADSRQFYKELNIGVARPTDAELLSAKHHFIGFLSITEDYSAGQFETDAFKVIDTLFQSNDYVICCGGSMLYTDALLYGLDELPSDKTVRETLQKAYEQYGISYLQKALKEKDEVYHGRVDLNNPHRLIRALEVCLISGRTYSALRKRQTAERPFETIKIGLMADRTWLYDRINRRVDMMMLDGLEVEARILYPMRHLNALNTVGYKELFDYFDKKLTLQESVEKIKQHTRNFAKRQLTWWRRDSDIKPISVDQTLSPLEAALTIADSTQ